MKNISRILALVLVVIMVTACGTAGGGGGAAAPAEPAAPGQPAAAPADGVDNFNPFGYPIVNERITLNGWGSRGATHTVDWPEVDAFITMEEITNIHIDWTLVPPDGVHEARNLAFASGDLPDFFIRAGGISVMDQINFGAAGMLIPLNDLIYNYAYNFRARAVEHPHILRGITLPDGNIFSMPQAMTLDVPTISQKFWMNMTWIENLGLEVPNTLDEITAVLKAFRDGDPNQNGDYNDEIPYSDVNSGNSLIWSTAAAFGMGGLGNTGKSVWLDRTADGEVRFVGLVPEFKDQMMYLNNWWEEGLIDPEIFTHGSPEFTAKANQNLIGAKFNNDNNQQLAAYHANFDTIRAPIGIDGTRRFTRIGAGVTNGTFVITSANQFPRETMRWVDFFYSYEGARLIRIGREGLSFDIVDGVYVIHERLMHCPEGLSPSQAMSPYAIAFAGGGMPEFIHPNSEHARLPPLAAQWHAYLMQDLVPGLVVPQFLFTAEEQNELHPISSDILSFMEEMRSAFITGARGFDEWDDFITQLERMNVHRFVEIYQDAVDRWIES